MDGTFFIITHRQLFNQKFVPLGNTDARYAVFFNFFLRLLIRLL
jgi:hypothetical protein